MFDELIEQLTKIYHCALPDCLAILTIDHETLAKRIESRTTRELHEKTELLLQKGIYQICITDKSREKSCYEIAVGRN